MIIFCKNLTELSLMGYSKVKTLRDLEERETGEAIRSWRMKTVLSRTMVQHVCSLTFQISWPSSAKQKFA